MRTRNGNQNGNHQDPSLERELAAVDAALGGQPVDADLTDLAKLALALQAERPRLGPRFAEELDARVAAGFPRIETGSSEDDWVEAAPGGGQPPRKPVRRRFRLMPAFRPRRLPLAFGTAASLLIVVTAVLSSGVLSGEDGGRLESGRPPGETAAGGPTVGPNAEKRQAGPAAQELADEAPAPAGADAVGGASEPAASVPSTSPAPSRRARVLPHVRNRQVERDAALTLATPREDVEDTADGVIRVTDRYEGFVLRSSVSGGDEGRAGATLDLRIPSDRLQPALRDLSELAHVRSRTQTAQDITARFVSARSRLNDAAAERRALLRQLARARTPNETASIRARLRLANRQIAAARSSLRGLRNRVDFSTVAVAIEPDDSLKANDGGWSPGDALHDAVGILGTSLGVLLVSLAVLVPLAALALLGLLASSRIRRKRRERALDHQSQN